MAQPARVITLPSLFSWSAEDFSSSFFPLSLFAPENLVSHRFGHILCTGMHVCMYGHHI